MIVHLERNYDLSSVNVDARYRVRGTCLLVELYFIATSIVNREHYRVQSILLSLLIRKIIMKNFCHRVIPGIEIRPCESFLNARDSRLQTRCNLWPFFRSPARSHRQQSPVLFYDRSVDHDQVHVLCRGVDHDSLERVGAPCEVDRVGVVEHNIGQLARLYRPDSVCRVGGFGASQCGETEYGGAAVGVVFHCLGRGCVCMQGVDAT